MLPGKPLRMVPLGRSTEKAEVSRLSAHALSQAGICD